MRKTTSQSFRSCLVETIYHSESRISINWIALFTCLPPDCSGQFYFPKFVPRVRGRIEPTEMQFAIKGRHDLSVVIPVHVNHKYHNSG